MTMVNIPEQDARINRPIRPTYGYYRQPNGWITVSPLTDMDELKYRREGWQPLRQYGTFEMATDWAANHPLEVLFMKGGARELSVDQIVKQGLYIDPPKVPVCGQPLNQDHKRHTYACMDGAKPVVFPQLAGVQDLGPFPCQFDCGRELPTLEARNQHESVMHAPEKSDERTGESLAAALVKGFGGAMPSGSGSGGGTADTMMASAVTAMMEQMAALKEELAVLKAGQPPQAEPVTSLYTQLKHNHKGPYGQEYLVEGCPRCGQLQQEA